MVFYIKKNEEVSSVIVKFMKAVALVMRIGPDRILKLQEEMKKLQEESRIDPLTGLLNRRGFQERLDIEKRRSERHGYRLLIAYVDMDNLKKINDLQGYEKGDQSIVALADAIRRNCRGVDFAARLGGDEFVIFFSETTEGDDETIAERLKSELQGVSIGFQCYRSGDLLPIKEAMHIASCKMQEEKKKRKAQGRGI